MSNDNQAENRLIVAALCGLPGAGKSRIAATLAEASGWPILDRDQIRAKHFPDGRVDREATREAEAIMTRQLAELLTQGRSVILDGMTLARAERRREWAQFVHDRGGLWRLLFVECPLPTAIARVEEDHATGRHAASDRNADLVRAVANHFEPPDIDKADVIRIDGCAPPDGTNLARTARTITSSW
ncbi:AAA family ATPase [Natronospira sp.]|uniref:AAA family ATPase n=1 Tax=Natronospira sp. TaxID=2024970 RepID=UPI00387390E7